MNTLGKISNFVGNTFAIWVLLFGALAFFAPSALRGSLRISCRF